MVEKKDLIELIRYVVVGGLTTLVNFIIYFLCISVHIQYLFANTIAWLFAVLFAYAMNKKFVFKSAENDKKVEFIKFLSLRAITLVLENLLLFLFVELLKVNQNFSKIVVSILTVIGNYVFCKYMIFKNVEVIERRN